jgi:hypothetical protein
MVSVSSYRAPVRASVQTLWGSGKTVPTLLGLVLLAAAALKMHQLVSGTVNEDSYLNSPWFLISLVELELGLGIWLLLGFRPRQARFLALACFGSFAAVSLQQTLAGRSSCSCFGALAVRPWFTFLSDVGAMGALFHWHPERNIRPNRGRRTSFSRLSWPFFSIASAILFLPTSFFAATSFFHTSTMLLKVSPKILDMGRVQAGGRTEAAFLVSNSTDRPVTVARIETSCPCLMIQLPNKVLGPGQTMAGRAQLDLAHEKAFTGALGITVTLHATSGQTISAFSVDVKVKGC